MHVYPLMQLFSASINNLYEVTFLSTFHKVVLPSTHRQLRFKEAITEAIEVLEETRKAFKSKRLEALRKKLTQVLIEPE